jgi:hypothetical protein
MTWGIFICGELYMKTDREHLLELRKELNELTQLVIIMGIKITELYSMERAKQIINTARDGFNKGESNKFSED